MQFIDCVAGCEAQQLKISDTPMPELTANQVLVKVAAFGINRADLLQRAGKYPAPPGESPILGLEVAGEVIEVPAGLTTRFKAGDKVFGLVAGGAYAEYVAVEASHLLPLPSSLNYVQGAAVAECFLTAYQSMFVEHALKPQHKVLIHAGASGVGLAAIQLAKRVGCQVAVTASSNEKLSVCQQYGADQLINYRTSDFVESLKPNGVDLVIDFIGSDYTNRNLAVLNQDGSIIQLAILGGRFIDKLDMGLMLAKRACLKASTLRNRSNQYKTDLIESFERDWWMALSEQRISPVIDQVYQVQDIAHAHQRMEQNLNTGKLVCYW